MKFLTVLISLSLLFMAAMVFQALRQEMNLRVAKYNLVQSTAEIKLKEEAIIDIKTKIDTLKQTLSDAEKNRDGLVKRKQQLLDSTKAAEKELETCNNEKNNIVQKKTELTKTVSELKAHHEEAKKRAEEEIQSLKKQILDRDKAICVFADTTNEEARKLCELTQSQQ